MTQDALHENRLSTEDTNTYATNFLTPDFGEDAALFSDSDVATMGETAIAALQIKNVITGYRSFNLQGPRWHNFQFSVSSSVAVNKAVVAIALLGIYNQHAATNMQYSFQNITVTYSSNRKTIFVSGRVYVGDSDGFLRQLSFNLTAI